MNHGQPQARSFAADVLLLTITGDPASSVIANHAAYCLHHGYRHQILDTSQHPIDEHLSCSFALQATLRGVAECRPNGILAVLSEDAVILSPQVDIVELMDSRSVLVGGDFDGAGMAAIMLWRNCPEGLQSLWRCVKDSALGTHLSQRGGIRELLKQLEPVPWNATLAGVHFAIPVMHHVDPVWMRLPTFVAVMCPVRTGREGAIPALLRDAIVEFAQCLQLEPLPELASSEKYSVFNPGHRIAFVMLYTPNIAAYGRIAEARLKQYVEAAGHSAYVYRDLPHELGEEATGNWAKPWVMQTHLRDHDWVFWLDADILIQNPEHDLGRYLHGDQCAVLTRDVGGWHINSGLFALKNCEKSHQILQEMIARTNAVADKAGVYRSGGDQPLWIAAFNDAGWIDDSTLVDVLSLNTPWYFQSSDSFAVHYFEIWNELRALLMETMYRRTKYRFVQQVPV